MTRRMTLMIVCVCCLISPTWSQETAEDDNVLDHDVTTIKGEPVSLDKYRDDVLLIVNVASECGLTPQYKKLQELYDTYADDGLRVLAFPCNQFGGQEPGTPEQIMAFCESNYNVSFDLFGKIDVNGKEASELYQELKALELEPQGSGAITWNFEKFVVARGGRPVARFSPRVKPDAPELVEVIERELAVQAGAAE